MRFEVAYFPLYLERILYLAATADMQAYAHERGYASMEFANLLMADPQYDPEEGPPKVDTCANISTTPGGWA
jgi:hypothetical protein